MIYFLDRMENPKFRSKFTAPKMELCEKYKKYSFSFSPPDERCSETVKAGNTTVTVRELNILIKLQTGYLNSKLHSCYMELYPELSPTGRLHYHGTIEINNIIDFYYRDSYYLQQKGTYEIDEIKDPIVWSEYITKQQIFWKDYLDGYKTAIIPYKIGKVFEKVPESLEDALVNEDTEVDE